VGRSGGALALITMTQIELLKIVIYLKANDTAQTTTRDLVH
jgi:hypothetical protein